MRSVFTKAAGVLYGPHSERFYINPLDWLKQWGLEPPNVSYDPNLRYDPKDERTRRYIAGQTHDGTQTFFIEMMWKVLRDPLAAFSASWEENGVRREMHTDTVLGPVRVAQLFGPNYCRGEYPGVWERFTLPARLIVREGPITFDRTQSQKRLDDAIKRSYGDWPGGPLQGWTVRYNLPPPDEPEAK
jgi:hypothetical protein